ncbi:MAG: hypothetical protein D6714_05735, partial [Bacteroidetes bacterium]
MEQNFQYHTGSGDNVAGDKIQYFLSVSPDYQTIVEEIEELEEDLKHSLPPERAQKKRDKLDKKRAQLEQLKADVFRLYETFTRIPLNTERLKQAKALFDKGAFREADAILKAEEISREVEDLQKAKQRKEKELGEINAHLEDKAHEFLIKAQLWKTFYNEPNWFEKTEEYFDKALKAARTHRALFEYALFLHNHKAFEKAQPFYEESLRIYRSLSEENPRTF